MIRILPEALIASALLLLVLPLRWLICAVLAAVVHEAAHIAALLLLGGRLDRITIGIGSAVIEGFLPNRRCEIYSILAGPVASLSLGFFCRILPELAVCGFTQGLFNLIPVFPLDGGRLLRCVLECNIPEKKDGIERVMYILLILSAVYICMILGSFYDILIFIAFLLVLLRKTPCKQA